MSRKSSLYPKRSFELTLCSSYSQTKPVLLWNIILGVCSSRIIRTSLSELARLTGLASIQLGSQIEFALKKCSHLFRSISDRSQFASSVHIQIAFDLDRSQIDLTHLSMCKQPLSDKCMVRTSLSFRMILDSLPENTRTRGAKFPNACCNDIRFLKDRMGRR